MVYLCEVCKGLELGFLMGFCVIKGFVWVFFSGFVYENSYVYFLGFGCFCSLARSLGTPLWKGQRRVWKILRVMKEPDKI